MRKAVLVLDMPEEVCQKCRLCYETHNDSYMCAGTGKEIPDGEIPDWCPLTELFKKRPSKLPPMADMAMQYTNYENGWNDCVYEILKGN